MLNPSLRDLLSERFALDDDDAFASAVIEGLSRPQKSLPCRFFYDARGSALFEDITRLPEYYPTRTEAAILTAHAAEMAQGVPAGGVLVEFGSGSSRKTEILLRELPQLAAYVSIDVSQSALDEATARLAARFPRLDVRPIAGDFSYPLALPADLLAAPKTGFFPGSTIGNLTPVEAQRLLRVFRAVLAPGGRLIVGVDLKKDLDTLLPAYNDAAGVTAAFNLNLLARINREIGEAFDLAAFRHEAIYNPRDGRIEMHLVSLRDQEVRIRGRRFRFRAGETIHTENSYKYSLDEFRALAGRAGFTSDKLWTDRRGLFALHGLVRT
jgi:dimethylhistidine N-methyltransferase